MSIRKGRKLNQIQQLLPEGLIVDSSWLQQQGYLRTLISKYLHSGWLESPAHGVYRRPSSAFVQKSSEKWQFVVISLQTLLDLPVSVGGRTALELQGYAHYLLPKGSHEIHLYGSTALPRWTARLPLVERLVFHNAHLFENAPDPRGLSGPDWHLQTETGSISAPLNTHFIRQNWGAGDWPLILSTPERAILELLDEVPQRETFDQVDALFEGLTSLSPRRLNKLLADCRSVKTKRLFLWFAERHHHPWADALDRSRIDLGKGKRMLVRGGKFDSKFLITVPEALTHEN